MHATTGLFQLLQGGDALVHALERGDELHFAGKVHHSKAEGNSYSHGVR